MQKIISKMQGIVLLFLLLALFVNCEIDSIGPLTKVEHDEINEQVRKAVDFVIISKGLNVTESYVSPNNHTDSFICKTCLYTFTKFHNFLDKKYGLRVINEFMALLCSIAVDYSVCKQAINLYAPIVIYSIVEHYLDAEYICSSKIICKFAHYQELNADDYANRVLADKPDNVKPVLDENAPTLKVLHVTDIHTDMFYDEVIVFNLGKYRFMS
jgi:hypothetical protein